MRHPVHPGNSSDVISGGGGGGDSAQRVEYVCEQRWPSFSMERNYFLAAIFVTCYTIPLVVISGCYALIGRRVSNP